MMHEQYWMAADCPNCGEKDIKDRYKGARQHNSTWGHIFPCCSSECGRAFLNNPKRLEMEIELAEMRQRSATNEVAGLRSELKLLEKKSDER